MRFYQGMLPKIIWDPSKKRPLVEFDERGIFETTDEKIIQRLHEEGYPVDADMELLRVSGTLPHGGFQKKILSKEDLPSGREPIENGSNLHTPTPDTRIKGPANESQALAQEKAQAKAGGGTDHPDGPVKKRSIKRRKKA